MAAFRPFLGGGFDFAVGLIGGFTDMPTGKPSMTGGCGEIIGKAAKMKVDQYKTGMQFETMQRTAATKHFAGTGQKIDMDLFLPSAAPKKLTPKT